MLPNFRKQVSKVLLIAAILLTANVIAQKDNDKWRLQFAVGGNNTLENENNRGFSSKKLDIPTINVGLHHMFAKRWGAKLDFGFNRSSESDNSPEYKMNYTRLNGQVLYDLTPTFSFLPKPITFFVKAGPGVTFTNPLGEYKDNTYTYLNALGGFELHYEVSRAVSIYGDLSYVKALGAKNKYDVAVDGYSFNGDLVYAAIGVSIALTGCQYCF